MVLLFSRHLQEAWRPSRKDAPGVMQVLRDELSVPSGSSTMWQDLICVEQVGRPIGPRLIGTPFWCEPSVAHPRGKLGSPLQSPADIPRGGLLWWRRSARRERGQEYPVAGSGSPFPSLYQPQLVIGHVPCLEQVPFMQILHGPCVFKDREYDQVGPHHGRDMV